MKSQTPSSATFRGLFALLGLLACNLPLLAQTSFSTLRGAVKDPSGAAVTDTEISVVHLETNLQRSTRTNENGDYEIPDLQRGTYRLTAKRPGFQTFVADNIILESSQIRRIDVALTLGEVATQVTVMADAAVISTESAKIAGQFTARRVDDAPIVGDGRNPAILLSTMPFFQSAGGLYSLTFAGQRSDQVQQAIDGHTSDGANNQISNIHDVQEIVAVAVNNSAEFGRVGYYNMVQRSGGNEFHGRFAYWHENSSLAARDFFATQKVPFKSHTWSENITGPVRKNKTFFYFGNMIQKFPGSTFYLKNVPTAKMRGGDFSQLLALRPPTAIRDPASGTPFSGNVIPASRLNPVSQKVQQKYMPEPNLGGPDEMARNFGFVHPYPNDAIDIYYLTGRIDHRISEKNTIFGRWTTNWAHYVTARDYPTLASTTLRHSHHVVIADTHVFSPTLVNTFRFGFYKEGTWTGGQVSGYQPIRGDEVVRDLGLQGVNANGLSAMGFPRMNITGYASLNNATGGQPSVDDRDWGYFDSVTWAKGRHVIKFGGEFKPFSRFSATVPEGTFGVFDFNGSLTGNAYADFLMGLPFSSTRLEPLTNRTRLDREIGLFVQDTFKVSTRLTLDLGLRWDHFGPSDWDDALLYNWDPVTGNVVAPENARQKVSRLYPVDQIKVVTGEVKEHPERLNFAPRIGVAYRPFGDKTVIRGGYGMFTATNGRYTRALDLGPYQLSETFFNSVRNGQPQFALPNPFPGGAGTIASQSISGYPLNTDLGIVHQFNVTVERQIRDTGFRLSYVGSRNRGMNRSVNINKPQASLIPFSQSRRPFPQFVNATIVRTDGAQNFNALNFQVQRKLGSLTFDNHWTWASNYLNYQDIEDPFSPLQWSRYPFTTRHRVVFNMVWELPVGRGRRFLPTLPSAVDHVFGGWSLYWLGYLETGYFFSPSYSGSDPSNTNTFGGRPDRIANGSLASGQRVLEHWFDVSAFRVPQRGGYGNSSANILEGPGYNGQDLSIMKRFTLHEQWRMTFLAAMENFLNHPNFALPAANISVPTAGVISATKGGDYGARRKLVLRMRLEF